MFSTISFIMILFFSCTFIILTHPISMGLLILVQTLLIALLCGSISNNFWFSYILFLVFLGGLLILFAYMTSLVSNQTFKFSIFLYLFFMSMTLTMIMSFPLLKIFNWNFSTLSLFDPLIQMNLQFTHMNKLYTMPTLNITIFLAILLLLCLIVVVNMIKLNKGPLRSFKS